MADYQGAFSGAEIDELLEKIKSSEVFSKSEKEKLLAVANFEPGQLEKIYQNNDVVSQTQFTDLNNLKVVQAAPNLALVYFYFPIMNLSVSNLGKDVKIGEIVGHTPTPLSAFHMSFPEGGGDTSVLTMRAVPAGDNTAILLHLEKKEAMGLFNGSFYGCFPISIL